MNADKPARNLAIDAYRGLVMVLMMAEVLRLADVARAHPGNRFLGVLAFHQTHASWAGSSLHDLIQPSFSFLVGVALPYSLASRVSLGSSQGKLFVRALWRSLLLVALGVFLRSMHAAQTYFTFEDTLSQIGLGYPVLFLLGMRARKWQWAAFGVILFGYWLAWALYPVSPSGVEFQGFAAHWNKTFNLGNAFDQWFLNLFPREKPFAFNGGGYLTLSFIPTLGTMILGLIAGEWLREAAPQIPFQKLIVAGFAGILSGVALHYSGVCPIVKRIWTPAWTLYSGGICFLFLAAFCWLIEVKRYRKWAFPLVVVGMNSIAAYLIAHLFEDFCFDSLRIHLGLQPGFLAGVSVLLMYWLMLYWMFRRKLFLKI